MSIWQRENHFNNVRRIVVARRTYTISKRWHRTQIYGAIVLVGLTPVAMDHAAVRNAIGIAAAVWVAISFLVFEQIERHKHLNAVILHEQFDRLVFDLPWNGSLAPKFSDFYIAHIHRKTPSRFKKRVTNWYPIPANVDGPKHVLRCQQGNLQWSRKLYDLYRWMVLSAAMAGATYVFVFAVTRNISTETLIAAAILPSLPAMVMAFDAFVRHTDAKQDGIRVDTYINDVMARTTQTADDAKEIQDRIFELRRTGPLVPDLLYAITRSRLNEALAEVLDQP